MSQSQHFKTCVRRAVKKYGTYEALAERAGVWPNNFQRLLKPEVKKISAEMAVLLETVMEGEVSRCDLRPDLWPRERWT